MSSLNSTILVSGGKSMVSNYKVERESLKERIHEVFKYSVYSCEKKRVNRNFYVTYRGLQNVRPHALYELKERKALHHTHCKKHIDIFSVLLFDYTKNG